ncbi:MAG: hypothetical protein B5M56_01240 [Desulfococcus sp. 4484_241]|nr:MAG: hypothetical protein B5M56_01240 [Desulfococcus sp. 4484_241]
MRGCWNHDRFCRGVLSVEDAVVRGRLYEMPSGIPVLQVPESATAGDWASVHGELLTFDDHEFRLSAIDRLEGFHPGGPSLYRRVLVPVCIRQEVVLGAWAYAEESEQRFHRLLLDGRWPS